MGIGVPGAAGDFGPGLNGLACKELMQKNNIAGKSIDLKCITGRCIVVWIIWEVLRKVRKIRH
jgi:hypothetical protein